ncbi:MAG: TIGR02270 family protein [Gammaproteobacteria bacterium]|nr:TIGR02270 family protein [Gammaproteobacteria bacterium]MDH5652753.1 TIGR02270 family protein [Gammaproteobacteria bacterium]
MEQTASSYINPYHAAYRDLYEQAVIESSFLWILRNMALTQPHYTVQDVRELESRIDSHLDVLMTSLELGWEACESALELEEPGEIFTATVIAFRSREMTSIQKAVEVGLSNEECTKGLISALGWLPEHLVNPWIERFLAGKDKRHKFLGIAACSVRRHDPGEMLTNILQRDDCKEDTRLYSRSIRLIGELQRKDLIPFLNMAVTSDDENIKFWAVWSSILLGNKKAVKFLEPFILTEGPHHLRALSLAFRVLPIEHARSLISKMSKNDKLNRSVIKAVGILGDPHAVNWLISRMKEKELAKLAGESFSMITGLDLEQAQLSIEPPDQEIAIPSDDPDDENILMDEDENLPWPDMNKIAMLWKQYGNNFSSAQRYFMGQPILAEFLKNRIMNGYQRQRHAAALELALLGMDSQLINTHAGSSS